MKDKNMQMLLILYFFETSAKDYEYIEKVFKKITEE